jgi:hypothetical protein
VRQKLIDAGDLLCDVFEPAGAGLVADAARVLKYYVCRIAVIGQIKAGKSYFINALVQHDVLPESVDDRDANVHLRPEGKDGGVFHFFAGSEWEQLAEGGGL